MRKRPKNRNLSAYEAQESELYEPMYRFHSVKKANYPVDGSNYPVDGSNYPVAEELPSGGRPRMKQRLRGLVDLRGYRHSHYRDEIPETWDAGHVLVCMVKSYRTLAHIPDARNARPRGFCNGWPQYSYDFADLVKQEDASDEDKEHARKNANRVPYRPSRADITHMDTMFTTLYEYSARWPRDCAMLLSWAYAKHRHISIDLIANRHNVSKVTLMKKIKSLASVCAHTLNLRSVKPW